MPVGTLSTGGALSSMIPEEGSDTLETLIKQAIGRDHLIPFSRASGRDHLLPFSTTSDSPVQWIQLLNGLDQPDLHGWPFLTARVEMLKCGKCTQQFCSPINYRRHIRVHSRVLNANTECRISRDTLAAFWDKLSWEEAEELLSFKGLMIKEVPGQKITDALASSLRTTAIWSVAEPLVKAGSTLLEIIKTRHSGLPKSYELFRILDTAAEGTFLGAGAAESVAKHIFKGESVNLLDLKNLVASTGFLFELQLVKACFAEKDAEALRCQKLLVEEVEAEKRKADISEKKRQEKLRRKEHRGKEIYDNYEVANVVDSLDAPVSAGICDLSFPLDLASSSPNTSSNQDSLLESLQFESDTDIEAQVQHISQDDTETIEPQITTGSRQFANNRWQVPKSQRMGRGRSGLGQNHHMFKREIALQQGPSRNWAQKNGIGIRVWTKKYKVENDANSLKPPVLEKGTTPQIEQPELMTSALEEETTPQIEETELKTPALEEEVTPEIEETELKPPAIEEEFTPEIKEAELVPPALVEETTLQIKETELKLPALEEEATPQIKETELKPPALEEEITPHFEETECEQVMIGSIPIVLKSCVSKQEKNVVEKPTRADSLRPAPKRVASKQWRPVSRGGNKADKDNKDLEGGAVLDEARDQCLSAENCVLSEHTNNDFGNAVEHLVLSDGDVKQGNLPFCSKTAQEFLARRWNEAISGDHVKLVLSPPPAPGGSIEPDQSADSRASYTQKLNVVGTAENKVGKKGKAKQNRNKKLEKEQQKVIYIPKQKA